MSPDQPFERLRFTLEAADGREFFLELHEGRSVLAGRDLGAEVVIPDGRVSRHHANLSMEDSGLWLEDLHSQNGTLVNGESGQRTLLEDGDLISLGGYALRLSFADRENTAAEKPDGISLTAREVISADCADLESDPADHPEIAPYLGRLADRLEAGFLVAFRVDHETMTARRLARLSFEARQPPGLSDGPQNLPNEFLDSVIETGVVDWSNCEENAARALPKTMASFAASPVTVAGKVTGLIYVEKRTLFEALDIEILAGFCDRLGDFFDKTDPNPDRESDEKPAKGFYKRVTGEEAGMGSSGSIRAEGRVAKVAKNLVDTVGDQADL